ncbi:MAG: alanine racemase, partial [Actinomycetota bacterium]
MRLTDVDTPALVWDLDVVERNLERMGRLVSSHGVAHRPHAKSHKTWELAAMQREAGAIGHTVAKVGEAEVMVQGGFGDLLIAYPVLGTSKINRIAHLLDAGADITIAVDSLEVARAASADLGRPAAAGGPSRKRLGILIEIDSGFGRCGVQDTEQALELAGGISRLPGVELRGVMGFAGQAYGETDTGLRRRIGREEGRQAADVARALAAAGHEAPVVSVGCTPSTYGAVEADGVSEVRAGVYVFNDRKQAT